MTCAIATSHKFIAGDFDTHDKFTTSVIDISHKFITGDVNDKSDKSHMDSSPWLWQCDTSDKFITGVNDPGGKFLPVVNLSPVDLVPVIKRR